MTEKQLKAYVLQIIKAAKSENAIELIEDLLTEFREKAYIDGRHAVVDGLRTALDQWDIRPGSSLRS